MGNTHTHTTRTTNSGGRLFQPDRVRCMCGVAHLCVCAGKDIWQVHRRAGKRETRLLALQGKEGGGRKREERREGGREKGRRPRGRAAISSNSALTLPSRTWPTARGGLLPEPEGGRE